MFGNKQNKQDRLWRIVNIVRSSNGVTKAELASQLGVMRSTITKDMAVVETATGCRFWEDDHGRIYSCD